ncbi:sulfite exporter TauE/SafE family protein [Yoonia sp. 2307UL14-13]|uniref:sulfite exporter TauE/SafE family protein n=1 Tax=Yoonia sp. 2307UL14-13 TaxID=3126506 RepID=UPI0030A67DBC
MVGLLTITNLTGQEFLILTVIVVVAGIVRGFSGFALSALVMASGVLILPPIELIPICWCLEMVASILMAKSGWQEADRGVVFGLVIGSAVGVPIGLALLTTLPVETSKLIVLAIIIVLAMTQLAKIRLAFLATKAGLYLSGLVAGIVTGVAHVGGMVVALYVLSQNAPAAKMRAALVLYLFISMFTSLVYYILADVMNMQAVWRGLAFAAPAALGVWLGQQLFMPRFAAYYRPFCLSLLCALAVISAVRTQAT